MFCIIAILASLGACAADVPGIDPPAAQIRFPIGIAMHPANDRYLLLVNSNFDLRFNSSTVVVIDTVTGEVLPQHTVRLNSFAGDLALRRDGTRAFVTARGGGVLTVIDIDLGAERFLKCTDEDPEPGVVPVCSGRYVTTVAANPFGIFVQEPGVIPRGCTGVPEQVEETVFLTHTNTAERGQAATAVLSVVRSLGGNLPYELSSTISIPSGSISIAQHPRTGTLYLTSRNDALITLFRPGPVSVQQIGFFSVNQLRAGIDNRGVVFDPSGTRAFISSRSIESRTGVSSPALFVFDVTCAPTGRELNRLTAVIDLGPNPGKPAYLERQGRPDRIYVPCGIPGEVYVVDPVLDRVVDIVEVAGGASAVVFSEGARTGVGVQRAYVSGFRDDAVSVIELDESSPNFHREIARWRKEPRILP